ncbi:hypothetical protein JCM19236_444 [Vibrio sp. JCM 19236]|nr:hypothetical protein JCM19236_444 [Vibrio sp. JCM 19236]
MKSEDELDAELVLVIVTHELFNIIAIIRPRLTLISCAIDRKLLILFR